LKIANQLEHVDAKNPFQMMLQKLWRNLAQTVNYSISFGDGTTPDNIAGVWVTFTTAASPNTDFVITHNLGRLPVGYIPMEKSAAVDIYNGSAAPTTTQATLRASVGSVAVRLFVICLLLGVFTAKAQNVRRDDVALQVVTQNTSAGTQTYVTPISGAVITVCGPTATGIPCSPTVPVCSSSTDVACTQPNPISADSNGNYGFWVPPGRYQVSITSNNVVGRLITYDLPIGQDNNNNVSAQAFAGQNITAAQQVSTPLLAFTPNNGTLNGTPNNVTGEAVTEVTAGVFDKLAQTTNISAFTIATPLVSGAVRVCASLVVTTTGSSSSTLPAAQVAWTDADNSTSITKSFTNTDSGNALTTNQGACLPINPKLNTPINISTTGYAASSANSMAYSLHIRLENH
jgi:hypothetical protein